MLLIISRIMNNNAVVALDENGDETILLGKGIAFQKKVHDPVERSKIEKKFILESKNEMKYVEELFRSIPPSYINATNEIIETAKNTIGTNFKEGNLFISLVDHIAFAIERKISNEMIENPLLIEIKKFYPNEFKVGALALEIIEKHTDIKLDEDEAGYIAFNLINATLNSNKTSIKEITIIIKNLISIIESNYNVKLDDNSTYYIRFITHLKFFLYRLSSNKVNNNDEFLYKIAKDKFKKEYECAKQIAAYINDYYNFRVPNEELGYLMIHINSMILHNKK